LWTWGEQYLPNEAATYGIYVDSLGTDLGLQNGDKILAIGGNPVEKFGGNYLRREIIINDAKSVTVERNGQNKTISIDEKYVDILSRHENKGAQIYIPRLPFVLTTPVDTMPGAKAGLVDGDKVISLNGIPTPFYDNFVKQAKQNKGKGVTISVIRNERDTITKSLTLTERGTIERLLVLC